MSKHLIAFYVLVVVSIIGLTIFVEIYPISSFDLHMTQEIQEQRAWDLTRPMKFISFFGDSVGAPLSVIIASLFFFLTSRRREAWFTLAVIIPDLFNMLVKLLIHRPRPTLEDAKIFLTFTQTGFPSGHVVHYVVFFWFSLDGDDHGQKYFDSLEIFCRHPFCLLHPHSFNLPDLSWRPLGHGCDRGIFIRLCLPGNHP